MTTQVYLPARVRTLDPERPLAEALAIRDGRVLAVGNREEVLQLAGRDAERIELPGATIVPGLQDSHGHLSMLGRSLVTARLNEARSVQEVIALLKSAPGSSFQGDWLIGRGWDQNLWPGGEMPGRAELDAAFPDTPVMLTRIDGHAAWVNGAALKRAGLHAKTPDPEGGRILHDARGEPTGVLIDNAIDLVTVKLPPPSNEQLSHRLRAALERCAKAGITVVHDAGMDLRTFRVLQTWDLGGLLPLRVYAMADGQGADADEYLTRGPYVGRHLEMRAVKFIMDGALGSRGAAMHEPYSDAPGEKGLLLLTPETLEARARAFMAAGFQIAVHAIGDRANTLVLDVLERAAKAEGKEQGRHRLEHAQLLRKEDLPRVGALGFIASVQPTHATSDFRWAEQRLGKARLEGAYAWRSLQEGGAVLALGSDFPIESPEVLLGLYAARTRKNVQGEPAGGWRPEQRLSGEEALAGFTTGAAFASFAEERRGQLKVGQDGDFTVLNVDPVEDAPGALLQASVLLTVVEGRPLYDGR